MAMLNNQRVIPATHPRTHANEARREDAARSRCKDCANPGRKGHRSLIDFFHRFTNEIAEKPWFMIWLIYEKPRKIMIYQNHGVYIELIMCIIYDVCMISTYVYIYILYYIYNHDLLDGLLIYQMNYVSEWWLFHIAMEDGPLILWWWTRFFKNGDGLLFATLNNQRVSETVEDLPPFGVQKLGYSLL